MKMKYKGSRKGTRFAEIVRADGVREIARMEELIRQMAGQEERKFTISDGKMLVEVKDVADYEAFKVNYLQMKRAAIVATRERLAPNGKRGTTGRSCSVWAVSGKRFARKIR